MSDENESVMMDDSWLDMEDPSTGYIPPQLVPNGKEVPVTVIKAVPPKPEKVAEGKRYIMLTIRVDEEAEGGASYGLVNHILSLPLEDEEPSKSNFKKGLLKSFYEAFGIEPGNRNPKFYSLWENRSARATMKIEAPQEGFEERGPQNRITKLARA